MRKNIFSAVLEGRLLEDVEAIFKKLTQNFLFNIYSISNDIDVFIAFETMNNRGKPLSLLELLKNRLIYLTTKFQIEEYKRDALRKKINECWKSIYHNLGKNKVIALDDDTFLSNHFTLYFGSELILTDEKRGIRRLRSFRYRLTQMSDFLLERKFSIKRVRAEELPLTISEINAYVESLQGYVEIWFNINNPLRSDWGEEEINWLEKVSRLGFEGFSPLLLVLFKKCKTAKNRILILKNLERILFGSTLLNYYELRIRVSDYGILAVDYYNGKLTESELIKELDGYVKIIYNDHAITAKIIKTFKKMNFYNWPGLKYFLYEYEQFLRSKTKTNSRKLDWREFSKEYEDFITVEHIYPQAPKSDCWLTHFKKHTPKQCNVLKNSLGNLVPLSKPKNSSLRNNCFQDKLGNMENLVGYRYGSFSEIEIAQYPEWTPETILHRTLTLISFMEKNWDLNFGPQDRKIEMLGLEFVMTS